MRFFMRSGFVILAALMVAGRAEAQENMVSTKSVVTGVQARNYSIEDGTETRQFAFPLAFALPVSARLSLDVGAYYASTESEGNTISGLTDTQIRASYVFGRDALVATVMVNLPTGETQEFNQTATSGAAAANFLSFPVNAYRTGTSVTGGLAAATELGSWNVGLAGSVRYSGEYEPFSDIDTRYSPGTEARFKLGLERLFGSSRLTFGFTFSTFGNDNFEDLGGGGSGEYQPGNRFIGEMALAFLAGSGSITGYVWDYYRNSAGGTLNKENILAFGASGSWPIGANIRLEPLVESRFWSPEDGSGKLFGAGAALRIPLGDRFTFSPSGRFDLGSTQFPDPPVSDGSDHDITGWGFSGLLRYEF
jgi:hypothetical protein